MLSQPQLVFYRGTLCTSIEEPLPSKWASRALKYLHSGFKPWTRLHQVLIMEEIETFPVLWLSALQQSGAGHKNTGWTVDSSARSCLMSGCSGPCSVFTLFTWLHTWHSYSYTSLRPFVIYFHKDIPNWSLHLHHNPSNLINTFLKSHTKLQWAIFTTMQM